MPWLLINEERFLSSDLKLIYQTQKTMILFDCISKQQEESWKYDA